jgi:ribosome-binding protein aMBF1 (putative translation factor)
MRQSRRRAGISQRELAHRLHTKQSVVGRWESLATSPTLESVTSVALACGFAIEWRLTPVDPDLERVISEQLRRTPAERVSSAVNLARLRGA